MAKPIMIKRDKIYGDISATLNDDGDEVAIITGAGGDGKRLRYYFVVSLIGKKPLSIDQKDLIFEVFIKTATAFDSKIENNDFGEHHILTSALIPTTVAVGDFIERCIKNCNRKVKFLRLNYFVTNTHKPTEKEIKRYLKEFKI